MDDALLVSRAAGGDLDSFGQLYDQTFGRVYDFAWRVLRDAGAAGDVAREAFVRSARELPAGRTGGDFRAWLFGVAHAGVLARGGTRAAGGGGHEEAFGSFGEPDPCRLTDPGLAGGDDELPCLVWEGLTSLSARDYALLDLNVRQGLRPAELTGILNVNKQQAQTVVRRLRELAGDAVAGYVLARRASRDCPQLQQVLAEGGFPPFTDAINRAVAVHAAGCDMCRRSRGQLPDLMAVAGGLAPVAEPFALKGEVWRQAVGLWPAAANAGLGGASPYGVPIADGPARSAYGGGGPPSPPVTFRPAGGSGQGRPPLLLFAATAVGILLFAIVAGVAMSQVLGGDGDDGGGTAITDTATPGEETETPATTRTPGVSLETATADPNPSETSTPEDTPVVAASPTTRPPEPTDTPSIRTVGPAPEPTRTPLFGPRPTATPPAPTAPAGATSTP
ncbi:MAG: sigma factor [Dehalococcoidia bacterium]